MPICLAASAWGFSFAGSTGWFCVWRRDLGIVKGRAHGASSAEKTEASIKLLPAQGLSKAPAMFSLEVLCSLPACDGTTRKHCQLLLIQHNNIYPYLRKKSSWPLEVDSSGTVTGWCTQLLAVGIFQEGGSCSGCSPVGLKVKFYRHAALATAVGGTSISETVGWDCSYLTSFRKVTDMLPIY